MTEQERLETQARSFEFYAGLIDRAVGRGAPLPVWDARTADDYRRQAQEYRRRAAMLAAREQAMTESVAASAAEVPAQNT